MRYLAAAIAAFSILTLGCSRTHQARRVEASGFLGDYSEFKPGEDGEALLVYRHPNADFSGYDRMIVDPVSVWRPMESDLDEVPEDELVAMANYFHGAMIRQLSTDYRIVKEPGPKTLRFRGAITEAAKSWVVFDTLSASIPHMRLLSGIKRLATGTHLFVGRASVEGEIIDAETGQRLLAAVDRRSGAKTLRGSTSSWDDVKSAFNYWAERVRDRLRKERGWEVPAPEQ